ncbi:hypothetical protein BCR34DRAFT_235161 [Clohesyomyces aquaticus]|uniref:Uncharacterized protein n=1 Tax=Clohesyomyces aquaticus TaxID=1231657 RepID=A0A1Y1Y7I9_9PLEO|nr:hypothetical protein BCR34DRAFT_235161 [Clohesyomyces aquaticus]
MHSDDVKSSGPGPLNNHRTTNDEEPKGLSRDVFPFLRLPRELRDQIYNLLLEELDNRGDQNARIERRHLVHFKNPTAVSFLVILHYESLCIDRQVAAEALEALLKNHTVYLSCGPFVLKQILSIISESEQGKKWLKWLKKIELDWATFPNLRFYPAKPKADHESWWGAVDRDLKDNEYVSGTWNGHCLEENLWDYDGEGYDDNFFESGDTSLHPSIDDGRALPNPDVDPFGFSSHDPFSDPIDEPSYVEEYQDDLYTKLDLLVDLEVTPLFDFFSSSLFTLSSITIPLFFISKPSFQYRYRASVLPLRLRYWGHILVHALLLLSPPNPNILPKLDEVRVNYTAKDVWAAMEPCDDLTRMAKEGIFRRDDDEGRDGEAEVFNAVKAELAKKGVDIEKELDVQTTLIRFGGDADALDPYKLGDELEVVFTRRAKKEESARG